MRSSSKTSPSLRITDRRRAKSTTSSRMWRSWRTRTSSMSNWHSTGLGALAPTSTRSRSSRTRRWRWPSRTGMPAAPCHSRQATTTTRPSRPSRTSPQPATSRPRTTTRKNRTWDMAAPHFPYGSVRVPCFTVPHQRPQLHFPRLTEAAWTRRKTTRT